MILHAAAFLVFFVAAIMSGLAGNYMLAATDLSVCIWVHIATGYMRDARRYHFMRDHLSRAVDEDGDPVNMPASAKDLVVDKRMAEFRK